MKSDFPDNLSPDPERIPRHIAVIMDGNGRWAKKRLMNRVRGHEKGTETVREIVEACREIGVSILTLYAFSTENWQRSQVEISALMKILDGFLVSEREKMMKNRIRLNAIGEIERLPEKTREILAASMEMTEKNEGMILNLALSYGGRSEILRMVRKISEKVKDGELSPEDLTEKIVSHHLYTGDMADPDLLIRTSGEMRVSNFLLWQIAYTELHVTRTLWPDFTREELMKIIVEYQLRDRRFGKVKEG